MYRNLIKSTNLPHSIHRAAFKQCSTRQLSHSSSAKHSSFKTSKLLIASLVPSIIIYNYLSSSSGEPIRNDEDSKTIHYKDIPTHDLIEKTMDRANEQSKVASDAFAQSQAKLRQEKGLDDAAPSGSADRSNDGSNSSGTSTQVRTKDSNAKQAADERQEGNYTRKPNKGPRKDKQVYEQEENKPRPTKYSKPAEEPSSDGEQQEGGEGEQQEAAFNPETGEINWDCPCLGGMAHGPCGEEFKEAFSCFVFSETEPKGIDCIKKFETMRSCFKKHPDHYKEELYDDDKELDTKDVEHVVLEEADPAIKELKQGIDDGKVKK